MSQHLVTKLQEQFGDAILETASFRGDDTAVVGCRHIVPVCRWLREMPGLECNMLMDLCAVDYLGQAGHVERFEVVYHLYSTTRHHRVRLKVRVADADPVVDSVTPVWVGADWFEREAFDLFGIRFAGHPNLKRLLTFEEFEGHPLRKDYPVNRRPKIPTPETML